VSERKFTRLVDHSVGRSLGRKLVCISADQCTTSLDKEKNVVEWFGKCET